jgi:hypothetical protein
MKKAADDPHRRARADRSAMDFEGGPGIGPGTPSWRSEMETLMERVGELPDIQAVQKVIDRANVIEKRNEQLKRIMVRHFERAPAELLPELISAFGHQMH